MKIETYVIAMMGYIPAESWGSFTSFIIKEAPEIKGVLQVQGPGCINLGVLATDERVIDKLCHAVGPARWTLGYPTPELKEGVYKSEVQLTRDGPIPEGAKYCLCYDEDMTPLEPEIGPEPEPEVSHRGVQDFNPALDGESEPEVDASTEPIYLGDGVYFQRLDYGFELYLSNGYGKKSSIVIVPEVWRCLVKALSDKVRVV